MLLNDGELASELIGTRSSTEMIRRQNALTMKKSTTTGIILDGNLSYPLDSAKEMGTNGE